MYKIFLALMWVSFAGYYIVCTIIGTIKYTNLESDTLLLKSIANCICALLSWYQFKTYIKDA